MTAPIVTARIAAAAAAAGLAVVGLVVALVVAVGGAGAAELTVAQTAAAACTVTGPVPGLDAEQAVNAGRVVAAALAASAEDLTVAQVAVMVALDESGLRDLAGGDRDSVGLFQQRPSQGWGTAAQLTDPRFATAAFVRRLLAVSGWRRMAPWVAAQAVQRSATSDGSNYARFWTQAGAVVAAVVAGLQRPGACGQGPGGVGGPAGGHGLPAGYTIPPGTPPAHVAAVTFALGQLGKPYVWGVAGPGAFDCSGLTMAAWAAAGVHLDHFTGDQQTEGQPVDAGQLQPGDLVLTPGSDPPAAGVAGHVGIYLGDNLVESAIDPADGVAVQPWSTFVSGGLDGLRDPAPDT